MESTSNANNMENLLDENGEVIWMSPNEFRQCRKELGVSQAKFAEFLGLSFFTIQAYEYKKLKIPKPIALLLKYVMRDFHAERMRELETDSVVKRQDFWARIERERLETSARFIAQHGTNPHIPHRNRDYKKKETTRGENEKGISEPAGHKEIETQEESEKS